MLPKNLEAFIVPIIAMAELQFPRSCPSCSRSFENFGQFVQSTKPIGLLTDMRVESKDPMEIFSWTNCTCGSTLTLTCDPGGDMHAQFGDGRIYSVDKSGLQLMFGDALVSAVAQIIKEPGFVAALCR